MSICTKIRHRQCLKKLKFILFINPAHCGGNIFHTKHGEVGQKKEKKASYLLPGGLKSAP